MMASPSIVDHLIDYYIHHKIQIILFNSEHNNNPVTGYFKYGSPGNYLFEVPATDTDSFIIIHNVKREEMVNAIYLHMLEYIKPEINHITETEIIPMALKSPESEEFDSIILDHIIDTRMYVEYPYYSGNNHAIHKYIGYLVRAEDNRYFLEVDKYTVNGTDVYIPHSKIPIPLPHNHLYVGNLRFDEFFKWLYSCVVDKTDIKNFLNFKQAKGE